MKNFETQSRHYVQKKETEHLERLQDHVEALEILLQRANDRARECGCRQCRASAVSEEEKLDIAFEKLENERHRLYGKHDDLEEIITNHAIGLLGSGDLEE